MFERLEARATRAAAKRVDERKQALAEQLRLLLPTNVAVEPDERGVVLSGPGLGRRLVLDSSLGWTVAGLLG